jgi:hypothetical protein
LAYLGNRPAESFASFEKQVFTIVNSQTAYTLSHSVVNENDIRLVINNVVQEPGSGKAYTASGTTLTLSAALTNGTDTMYCVFLGRALQTVNPPNASVGASQLVDASITSAKLASGVLPTNTPAFEVFSNGVSYNIATTTLTKVVFTVEKFDTDSAYDTSTGRFTPQVAGKYFCYGRLAYNTATDFDNIQIALAKNGSDFASLLGRNEFYTSINTYGVVDLNGSSDYVELYTKQNSGGTVGLLTSNQNGTNCLFGAYKIIE